MTCVQFLLDHAWGMESAYLSVWRFPFSLSTNYWLRDPCFLPLVFSPAVGQSWIAAHCIASDLLFIIEVKKVLTHFRANSALY